MQTSGSHSSILYSLYAQILLFKYWSVFVPKGVRLSRLQQNSTDWTNNENTIRLLEFPLRANDFQSENVEEKRTLFPLFRWVDEIVLKWITKRPR